MFIQDLKGREDRGRKGDESQPRTPHPNPSCSEGCGEEGSAYNPLWSVAVLQDKSVVFTCRHCWIHHQYFFYMKTVPSE